MENAGCWTLCCLEFLGQLERTLSLLQDAAVGMAEAERPAPHHTAGLTHGQVSFLECSTGCFCFIVLIEVGFHRISLRRWENCKTLSSSYIVWGAGLEAFSPLEHVHP